MEPVSNEINHLRAGSVELKKPGRDPRPNFKVARFNYGVEDIKDLKEGMIPGSRGQSQYSNPSRGQGAGAFAHLRRDAISRAKERLVSAAVDGQTYFWPATENPKSRRHAPDEAVRLLAPFDPLVWDRRRFEHLWGWAYRFEAYTPAPKRVRGYYALPLLWQDMVIGWGNVSVADGALQADPGYVVGKPPREAAYRNALEHELEQLRAFLNLPATI